ncbi:MAG TPA: glucosamine-6-phosphate deaminase [Chitinophagaceae bacterium]|nr:glucosamine-6-phosphate deaminase [Chitinophagaceae bacterium]
MQLTICPTYQNLSQRAASDLLQILQSIEQPLICTASGASPAGLYKELVELVETNNADTSDWHFVGLDEWKGMNGSDEGSSHHQVIHQLFKPLNIPPNHICFFDGKADDLNAECKKTEDFIEQRGGITVAILGIGVNGHIAMNEPGTSALLRSHIATLHPSTQQIAQKYFKEPRPADTGITLGLATLLQAKHLFLLASGPSKAQSIYQMLNDPISEDLPATLLRNHPGLHIYLDKEAANLL